MSILGPHSHLARLVDGFTGEVLDSQSSVIQKQTGGDQNIVEKFNGNWDMSVSLADYARGIEEYILLMPCSVPLAILPIMISPLKGRKTIIRNLTGWSAKNSDNENELNYH
jgi:hypothetical protein